MLNGDVSLEDKKLAQDLTEMERTIEDSKDISLDHKAKAYVALAHDWYWLQMEEKGHELLLKAEDTVPGYSKDVMPRHMEEDPQYADIIHRMAKQIIGLIGGKHE